MISGWRRLDTTIQTMMRIAPTLLLPALLLAALTSAAWAHELGYLPRNTDLSTGISGLLDVSLLNEVLKTKSLAFVPEK